MGGGVISSACSNHMSHSAPSSVVVGGGSCWVLLLCGWFVLSCSVLFSSSSFPQIDAFGSCVDSAAKILQHTNLVG